MDFAKLYQRLQNGNFGDEEIETLHNGGDEDIDLRDKMVNLNIVYQHNRGKNQAEFCVDTLHPDIEEKLRKAGFETHKASGILSVKWIMKPNAFSNLYNELRSGKPLYLTSDEIIQHIRNMHFQENGKALFYIKQLHPSTQKDLSDAGFTVTTEGVNNHLLCVSWSEL